MLTIPPSVRVFLARGATDLRKSFDGLSGATRSVIGLDPLSGHLFVFCNRARNRLKVLFWDGSGFCLYHKRLARGTFAWPRLEEDGAMRGELRPGELAALLCGIEVSERSRRRWYYRAG